MSGEMIIPAAGVGLIGGIIVGMTGVGAGSVIAAMLLLFFPSLSPQLIVGSATVQAVAMKLFGVWARRYMKLREMSLGVSMAIGAAPLAVVGALVSHSLRGDVLRPILAWVLAGVGVTLVIQAVHRWERKRRVSGMAEQAREDDPSPMRIGLMGSVVGFIAGLTSVGTGTLFVSALAGPLGIEAHRAVAAALVAGLITLAISALTHIVLGHANAALVFGVCLGSVPGVLLGTAFARGLPARVLRGVIGGAIVVAAVIALARAG